MLISGHLRQHNPQIWVIVATALCVFYPESPISLLILDREWSAHKMYTYNRLHGVSWFMEADHWLAGSSKMFTIYGLFVIYVLLLLANTGFESSKFLDCNLNFILDNFRGTVITGRFHSTGKIKDRKRKIC